MTAFILRFIVFSGLLYLAYHLLFSRMSFFKLNRSMLLLIPAVSLLIPLIAPLFEIPEIARPVLNINLDEIALTNQSTAETGATDKATNWYWLFYIIGAAAVLFSIILGFLKGWNILKKSSHAFENVHVSIEASGPFAFFKKIVIPASMLQSEKLDSIISHEKAHVEQNHSLDILYYNLLSAVFWFNPFIHLLSRELRQTHECLADEAALEKTSRESYAQLLLSSAFGSEISFDAANRFFNSSLIKNRITMMYKSKTNTKMKGLYLVLLPLLVVMIIASCQKTEEEVDTSPTPEEKSEIIGFAEADQPPLFPGCDVDASKEEQLACFQQGIIKHVQENFRFPDKVREQEMSGKLYVGFTISESGDIKDAKVLRGLEANTEEQKAAALQADQYAIELVNNMPQMIPAIIDGKKTGVTFTLPINLKHK